MNQIVKVYAAGQLGVSEAAPTIETALADPDPTVRETAAWSLNTLHPKKFALHHDTLMDDEDPLVARLATRLNRSD